MNRAGAMSDERHYHSSSAHPVPGSNHEFHMAGVELLASETIPLWWIDPIPITDDMDPSLRAYAERANPAIEFHRSLVDDQARSCLIDAGIDPTALGENASPAVRLVAECVRHQVVEVLRYAENRAATNAAVGPKPLVVRHEVMFAARFICDGSPSKAAEYLNEGGRSRGLDGDHVYRGNLGFRAYILSLSRSIARLETQRACHEALFLHQLRSDLARDPHLRRFRGAELLREADRMLDVRKLAARYERDVTSKLRVA